jgi:hypothetical protein
MSIRLMEVKEMMLIHRPRLSTAQLRVSGLCGMRNAANESVNKKNIFSKIQKTIT